MNNHLDLFYFNQTEKIIASRAGLSITKLFEAIQRGEKPMNVSDVDESDVDESDVDKVINKR